MKNKKNIGELIGYIISGFLVFCGLGLFITSVVGYYLEEGNVLENGEWLGLGFRGWGYIVLAVGLVIGVIVLLTNAKKVDLEEDRRQKRAQRIGE